MSAQFQFCVAQSDPAAETWTDAAALGIGKIIRRRVHAGTDTLAVELTGATALTDDPLWACNTVVRLRRVDAGVPTLLFLGRVQPFARTASGAAEGAAVEIRGAWDWFERTVMRQQWRETNESLVYAPHVVLFSDGSGSRITTGAQITLALQCAVSAGCPVQAGSILSGYTPPFDEQTNVSVADVIVKCLANHPHAVLWVDYSTRTPTVNVASRLALPSFTASLTAGQAETLSITSREDLIPNAVAVAFIRTNTDGDRTYVQTTVDHAPVIAGETAAAKEARLYAAGSLWGTFELEGSNAQYVEQELVVEAVNWDANKSSAAWWKARVPGIADAAISAISNPAGQTSLPNFVTEGAVSDWMGVEWANETFSADATLQRSNSEGVIEKKVEKISFTAVTTDGTSKTYKKRVAYDSGEIPPAGLAAAMWAEWQQTHYDGQITLTDDEAPAGAGPGMTLNITGGRAEWAAMAAMIVQVEEDYAAGTLSVSFGVPAWIDLDSRMAWIRNCRTRRYAWSRNMQGGEGDGLSGAGGPMAVPSTVDGIQPSVWIRQRFINPSAEVKHEADLNIDDVAGAAKRILKFREMVVPYLSGDAVKAAPAFVLCSGPTGDEVDVGGSRPADPANPASRGSTSETDLSGSELYNPASPGAYDGITLVVSLGAFYDHTAATPVLKDFRVALTWPNAIAPKVSAATAVPIDYPEY